MSLLTTACIPMIKLFSTNSTNASITDPTPTTTEPTGDGVIGLKSGQAESKSNSSLIFFGAGTAAQTASAKVFLWHSVNLTGGTKLWVPTLMLDLSLTLGASTGVAGCAVIDTDLLVKAITANAATTTNSKDIQSPNSTNGVAKVDFDNLGADKLQVVTAKGAATNINVLWKGY